MGSAEGLGGGFTELYSIISTIFIYLDAILIPYPRVVLRRELRGLRE